jgi:DNA-binding PadR family transcriptional regulator
MRIPPGARLDRDIVFALWKIHILHHAAEGPVWGHWISEELRHHGYRISPGTLYPFLRRMERQGWLRAQAPQAAGATSRRSYVLTPEGARALAAIRVQVEELRRELIEATESPLERDRTEAAERPNPDAVRPLPRDGRRRSPR